MTEATKGEIESLLDRADAATTDFTGAMKPLKIALEPFRHIEPCMFMSTYTQIWHSICICLAPIYCMCIWTVFVDMCVCVKLIQSIL